MKNGRKEGKRGGRKEGRKEGIGIEAEVLFDKLKGVIFSIRSLTHLLTRSINRAHL